MARTGLFRPLSPGLRMSSGIRNRRLLRIPSAFSQIKALPRRCKLTNISCGFGLRNIARHRRNSLQRLLKLPLRWTVSWPSTEGGRRLDRIWFSRGRFAVGPGRCRSPGLVRVMSLLIDLDRLPGCGRRRKSCSTSRPSSRWRCAIISASRYRESRSNCALSRPTARGPPARRDLHRDPPRPDRCGAAARVRCAAARHLQDRRGDPLGSPAIVAQGRAAG
jgi:hypothetical protein